MNDKEATNRRLMLLSKWKNSRRSITREKPKTPEIPPELEQSKTQKNARKNSKIRECLIPISNEPPGVTDKPALSFDNMYV